MLGWNVDVHIPCPASDVITRVASHREARRMKPKPRTANSRRSVRRLEDTPIRRLPDDDCYCTRLPTEQLSHQAPTSRRLLGGKALNMWFAGEPSARPDHPPPDSCSSLLGNLALRNFGYALPIDLRISKWRDRHAIRMP
jgi:hypothetical protein